MFGYYNAILPNKRYSSSIQTRSFGKKTFVSDNTKLFQGDKSDDKAETVMI